MPPLMMSLGSADQVKLGQQISVIWLFQSLILEKLCGFYFLDFEVSGVGCLQIVIIQKGLKISSKKQRLILRFLYFSSLCMFLISTVYLGSSFTFFFFPILTKGGGTHLVFGQT